MTTAHTPTPESDARRLLKKYGLDGASRYARRMEDRYESEHWQQVGYEIQRAADRAALAATTAHTPTRHSVYNELDDVLAQRDALVAALEQIRDNSMGYLAMQEIARAALAAATGDKA